MWTSVKRVHEASEMNASHRPSMEDEHRAIDSFLRDDPQSALFAVCSLLLPLSARTL